MLSDGILSGDQRSLARLIRRIEDNYQEALPDLKRLYTHTGRAFIVGFTGNPGAGKSTLLNNLITHLRGLDKTVGVIAVDPTSPFTGGAILGDRIRMQQHSNDRDVFIRSLATRGHLGGVTRYTLDIINVLDAFGKDVILVETVGVGQDEVEIVSMADTSVVMMVPGMGDDVQSIKAGILEIADIFVINKSDRPGADRTQADLEAMLTMNQLSPARWTPKILKTTATTGNGIKQLWDEIEVHHNFMLGSPNYETHQTMKLRNQFLDILKEQLYSQVYDKLVSDDKLEAMIQRIAMGKEDPYTCAEKVIKLALTSEASR